MTQADWIKGKDPAAMLAHVRQFLGRQRWMLYNVALARRVESLIPPGPLHEMFDNFERSADKPRDAGMIRQLREQGGLIESVVSYTETRQRTIVLAADPDAEATGFYTWPTPPDQPRHAVVSSSFRSCKRFNCI